MNFIKNKLSLSNLVFGSGLSVVGYYQYKKYRNSIKLNSVLVEEAMFHLRQDKEFKDLMGETVIIKRGFFDKLYNEFLDDTKNRLYQIVVGNKKDNVTLFLKASSKSI